MPFAHKIKHAAQFCCEVLQNLSLMVCISTHDWVGRRNPPAAVERQNRLEDGARKKRGRRCRRTLTARGTQSRGPSRSDGISDPDFSCPGAVGEAILTRNCSGRGSLFQPMSAGWMVTSRISSASLSFLGPTNATYLKIF